jgi:hypothetical protein
MNMRSAIVGCPPRNLELQGNKVSAGGALECGSKLSHSTLGIDRLRGSLELQ